MAILYLYLSNLKAIFFFLLLKALIAMYNSDKRNKS